MSSLVTVRSGTWGRREYGSGGVGRDRSTSPPERVDETSRGRSCPILPDPAHPRAVMLRIVVTSDDPPTPDDAGPPASPWSRRMPTTVAGLALGVLVCVVVIALCLAALAGAVGLLVGP